MVRCKLPSALLAEWPGSFTCHCGNAGMERTPNKNQYRKITLEKNILPPLLPGIKPATYRPRVRRSTNRAIPTPRSAPGSMLPERHQAVSQKRCLGSFVLCGLCTYCAGRVIRYTEKEVTFLNSTDAISARLFFSSDKPRFNAAKSCKNDNNNSKRTMACSELLLKIRIFSL